MNDRFDRLSRAPCRNCVRPPSTLRVQSSAHDERHRWGSFQPFVASSMNNRSWPKANSSRTHSPKAASGQRPAGSAIVPTGPVNDSEQKSWSLSLTNDGVLVTSRTACRLARQPFRAMTTHTNPSQRRLRCGPFGRPLWQPKPRTPLPG